MTPSEFIKSALRTLSGKFSMPTINPPVNIGSASNINVDVLHAIIGFVTESAEMMDVVKKNLFYGKPTDYVNLDEEVGDLFWYAAIYCNARGLEMEAIMERNIRKLRIRYPDKFVAEQALTRDLTAERKELEK